MWGLVASVGVSQSIGEISKDIAVAWFSLVSTVLYGPAISAMQRCHFLSTMTVTIAMIVVTGVVRVFALKHIKQIAALEMSLDFGTAALAISLASVSAAILCGLPVHLPDGLTYNWVLIPILFSIAVYLLIVGFLRETVGQPLAIQLSGWDKLQNMGVSVVSTTLGLLSLGFGVGLIITEHAC